MKLNNFMHFASYYKCNLKCKHCSVYNITAIIHPYEQVKNEMKQLYNMGIRILFFCSGETLFI